MDWTARVNEINEYADDVYSTATCKVDEYLSLNPDENVGDYVDALIEADADVSDYDESERRVFRNRLLKLANDDYRGE